jgi:hypothetical protein
VEVIYGKYSRIAGNLGSYTNQEVIAFEQSPEPLEIQCASPERSYFYYLLHR